MSNKNMTAIMNHFNSRFKCSFSVREVEETIKVLKLEQDGILRQTLVSLTFLYFKKQNFKLSRRIVLNESKERVIKALEKLFKKSIFYENSEFLIIIKNKFKKSYDKGGVGVTACERNEIAIYDCVHKTFFCIADSVKKNFEGIVREEKLKRDIEIPREVTSSFLKKILDSNKLSVHEIELYGLEFPDSDIEGFYLKAGSKKTRINKKIKQILNRIFNDEIRAFNIKSVLLSEKGKKKGRLRIALKQDGPRKYHLEIQTKNPPQVLKELIEKTFLEEGIEFNKSVVFTDEPIEEAIIQLVRKRKIYDYDPFYKKDITNWDQKYHVLKYEDSKLKVDGNLVISAVNTLASYYSPKEALLKIENIKIKGVLFTRKKDKRSLFLFLNKGSAVDKKRIELLISDKRIPFLSINLKKKIGQCKQEINFTKLNEYTEKSFNEFLDSILDNPQLFANLRKNFENSYNKLLKIKQILSKIKWSNKKGSEWERVCSGVFDYCFNDTFPLGRVYLPDGITYFGNNDTMLWDAKGLGGDPKCLKKSVKPSKKNKEGRIKVKDIFYIRAFKKINLKFDYYAYLTTGVTKSDFDKVKSEIDKELKHQGINVNIVCLTNSWISSFASQFLNEDNASRLHKNLPEVVKILKAEFAKGYLDSFAAKLFEKIGVAEKPDISTARKEVKKLMKEETLKIN